MQMAWIFVAPGDDGTESTVRLISETKDRLVRFTRKFALVVVGVPTIWTLITSVTPAARQVSLTVGGGGEQEPSSGLR